ncbi:MAG: glycosyltransferase [Thermoanaerobacteraceae bacterium]|nr:glycosyltransferase [Thermoanaerobacteraceae bacterium]
MAQPTTILLALMKLDIGGAETHAVVLCRHLTEMGYRVIMASYGGCFVEEIARYGVKHYRVPLHLPRISYIWQSMREMRRIVAEERVDLIHAHARIPAFVAAFMGRPPHVRFITTAHFNFDYRYGLKYLSQWGERTIAVSEDIKEHLVRHFGVPAEQIVVIPNGIDTEAFSPAAAADRSPDRGRPAIVLVSRLDGELATVAQNLIAACAMVYELAPELRVSIVGDGNRRADVEKSAAELNARAGREVVRLLGACTHVNKILVQNDLVVGVSRVALEAMACARPVLLAGPQGFGGLLDAGDLPSFQKDNFTARSSSEQSTVDNLARALREFLRRPPDWRAETGRIFREFVIQEYSGRKMARDVARVYEEVLSTP